MNTAGSVAYGWGALIVAAGISFYYAKQEIDARRKDAQIKGTRSLEKLDWEQRIARAQQEAATKVDKSNTPSIPTSFKPSGGGT
ncbi:hypothetical protein CI109_101757 [Kwoniella shandongensis]|uniref:Uncharacterized protein n=1 Tax=Kwoniella shandongensis TaxID=1734106 RepID=A0A5M6C6F4_9TREE|nr:uncharacterized protein CI109_001121 [Kwoniella shandongensis]KAA5530320.1 hypothetical protein CI109_001121 [Kwoniella shandongensis]